MTIDLFARTAEGLGSDTLAGFELVTGSDFDDTISGGREPGTLTGGEGDDKLTGGAGEDLLDGGPGDDTISGGRGEGNAVNYDGAPNGVTVDLVAGTATGWGVDDLTAIQVVIGSDFDDSLTGDEATNTFAPGEGDDTVIGGGGRDGLDLSTSQAGVIVDLVAGTVTGQGTDTLTGISAATGSGFADTLTGTDRRDVLNGGPGDDVLNGGPGDDTLDGGDGTDTLNGGPDSDICLNGENNTDCES